MCVLCSTFYLISSIGETINCSDFFFKSKVFTCSNIGVALEKEAKKSSLLSFLSNILTVWLPYWLAKTQWSECLVVVTCNYVMVNLTVATSQDLITRDGLWRSLCNRLHPSKEAAPDMGQYASGSQMFKPLHPFIVICFSKRSHMPPTLKLRKN